MIEVNRLSWHAKVYMWWYYAKFPHKKDIRYYKKEKEFSNLCPYVRVVLLWAPLRWFFIEGKIGRVPIVCIFGPPLLLVLSQLVGYISFDTKMFLRVLAGVVTLALLAAAIVFLIEDLVHRYRSLETYDEIVERNRMRELKILRKEEKKRKKKKKEGPTFWELLKERALATHDRICPEIVFKTYTSAEQTFSTNSTNSSTEEHEI